MVVCVFNYILDSHMLNRGLIPFDLIIPTISDPISIFTPFYYQSNSNILLINLNPFLFFIGLAVISPISTYLSDQNKRNLQLTKILLKSLFEGFLAIILIYIIGFLIIISLLLFSLFILSSFYYESYFPNYIFFSILDLLIFGIMLLLFQRTWVFLVIRGLKSELTFKDTLSLARKTAFEGQLGFLTLIIIHGLIQIIVTLFFRPIMYNPYGRRSFISSLHPISFLALMSFEIGFFLILIIYQHIQLKKQLIDSLPKNEE
jgi:hypothetical protein